ncbi:MAG: phage terminase large subunit [Bradymonadaceae bacterium]
MAAAHDERYLAALESEFVENARDDFLEFLVYTYGPEYIVNWHHRVKAKLLEAWARGIIPRLLLHEPPRHGKTEQASIRLPPWIFGKWPDAEIISASRDADYAKKLSRKCKRVINSPEYRRVFPDTRIPEKRVASDEREEWRNTAKEWEIVEHGGHYECFGAGQGIAGAGGQFIIIEDPYPSREKAESKSYREGINDWYDDDIYERREDDSRILVIHTRWHTNDLSGKLQRDSEEVDEKDDWFVYKMPGLKLDDEKPIAYGTGDLDAGEIAERLDISLNDPRDPGEALWPHKRSSADFIAAMKSNPRKFWSLIQQEPQPPGGQILEHDWLKNRWNKLPSPNGDWFAVCDPKHGSKEPDSSRAVIQLWLHPANERGRVYLVDQVRGIWSQTETEDMFRILAGLEPEEEDNELIRLAKWRLSLWSRVDTWVIEDEGDGPGIKSHLEGDLSGIKMVEPWADKEQRARDVTPFWRSGDVVIPMTERYDWVNAFVAEHQNFPGGEHDDQVDTSTYAIDHALGSRGDSEEDGEGGFYDGWFEDTFKAA